MKRNNNIEKENLRKRVDFISKKILKEFLPYSGFSEQQQDEFINTLSEFKNSYSNIVGVCIYCIIVA